MTKVAIIIPAYNESENLEKLLDKINDNLNNVKIFIVDDSKTNESEHLLSNKKNDVSSSELSEICPPTCRNSEYAC